jgi:geranylgeranyl diphosphate synthase type I
VIPTVDELLSRYAAALDREMRAAVPTAALNRAYAMLEYHLGWVDRLGQPVAGGGRGKRLRPNLLLLAAQAAGGDPVAAMPAAAAVELLHNFSLIHDDIQDRSDTRHGRPTVWTEWGIAQAINAGDAMHAIASRSALRCVETGAEPRVALEVADLLHACCLRLVEGQYLDLEFERRDDVTPDEYLAMIDGKTAALIAASIEMGALLGGAGARRQHWRSFGQELGRAFQVVDDVLGVWGDPKITGKPAADDVVKGKRALPYLVAMQVLPSSDAARLRAVYGSPGGVVEAIQLLDEAGAREACRARAAEMLELAMASLEAAEPTAEGKRALTELARFVVERDR